MGMFPHVTRDNNFAEEHTLRVIILLDLCKHPFPTGKLFDKGALCNWDVGRKEAKRALPNRNRVCWSRDINQPIRGQYSSHVT